MFKRLISIAMLVVLGVGPVWAATFGSASSDTWARTTSDVMRPMRVTDLGNLATTAPELAVKITVSGANTYVATAPIGTAQSAAAWQVKKINVSGGTTTITWADGNANFDNVATDLTALTYN